MAVLVLIEEIVLMMAALAVAVAVEEPGLTHSMVLPIPAAAVVAVFKMAQAAQVGLVELLFVTNINRRNIWHILQK